MKFAEWFNPMLEEHMEIACYFYDNLHWPVSEEIENLDQSDRIYWNIIVVQVLLENYIKIYKENKKTI